MHAAETNIIPIVGLGASAGGLEALEHFFEATPGESGVAFVVITHQHPTYASLLPEILARHTPMAVEVVRVDTPVAANTVYLPPPGIELQITDGVLRPHEGSVEPLRLPIDRFFRALAMDRRERAVGIVLSGTGSDGTLGVKEIKGAAGMVMAQQPDTAGQAGMPSSAIATEVVDYVLPPAAMPAQLLTYLASDYLRSEPPDDEADDDAPADAAEGSAEGSAEAPSEILDEIFSRLLAGTGYDFSGYKRTTIHRRIERRMNVLQSVGLQAYAGRLREDPQEVRALVKELLIGVTGFFRDGEAFAALEQQLREHPRPVLAPLRVWVPGCSTGEEAYSLAILLRERMDEVHAHPGFLIFATDLDESAIETARAGVYPEGIAADVSPARLERFFIHDEGRFQVKKSLREHLVFAQQNLIADPPFTKLDLLSCRNLLIYFDAELQRRLLPIFHYSLNPGGLLFLGSSESIGNAGNLFSLLDKRWKIFRRREVAAGSYVTQFPAARSDRIERGSKPDDRPTRDIEELLPRVLLEQLAPPSALLQDNGQIVHIHGRTGAFLEPAPGSQSQASIFDMAREGLRFDLAAAMRQAGRKPGPCLRRGVLVKSNGSETIVDLRVERLLRPEPLRGLLLLSFLDPRPPAPPLAETDPTTTGEPARVDELERELRYAKETNQGTVEELETANEELKSTNEELQSTNEELQSANEELETSKEEMQSLNEELQTVNAELQSKVEELSRTTDDMKNLLNGTNIATIFLDEHLDIKRYTEQAKDVIRLIPSDVGRPIGDLVSTLHYDKLAEDAKEVLRTLMPKRAEIRGTGETWYLMRILPYRTTENVIDGLVVTFVDITEVKQLQAFEQRMIRALGGMDTFIFGLDTELRVTWISGPLFAIPTELIRGQPLTAFLPATPAEQLTAVPRAVLASGEPVRTQLRLELGATPRTISLYVEPVHDDGGELVGLTCVCAEQRPEPAA